MLNPAVDSSELEVNIITDEAVGSLEPKILRSNTRTMNNYI